MINGQGRRRERVMALRRSDIAAFDHSRKPRPYWALGIFFLAVAVDGWSAGRFWVDGAVTWAALECAWYLWRMFQHKRFIKQRFLLRLFLRGYAHFFSFSFFS